MPFWFEDEWYFSKDDVRDRVEPAGIDVDTFLSRLNPRKVFKVLFKGSDLNEAYMLAASLEDGVRKPIEPVDLPETRRRRSRKPGKTYGGFSAEVIGLEQIR